MSNEGSTKGSNSHSESSSSSPNQGLLIFQGDKDYTDLTLVGSQANLLSRTGTVRRASTSSRKQSSINLEDLEAVPKKQEKIITDLPQIERIREYRKSVDSVSRISLESISEYGTRSSFSSTSMYPSVEYNSIDSSSSDNTDYAVRSLTDVNKDERTIMSPSSSYLSWIESVNSEYFCNSTASAPEAGTNAADNKVGEWNNFWLNYNSARSKYMSSQYLTATDDRGAEDLSDERSTCSTQKEFTEKNSTSEQVLLSLDEVNEAIKCSQRITEIFQNALKRSEHEFLDDSRNDSYYSHQSMPIMPMPQNPVKEEVVVPARERSFSYVFDTTELQKQKSLLKPTPQSSSSSCINALLNTGVADILKRVITKRRDVMGTEESVSRSSFSEWSSAK